MILEVFKWYIQYHWINICQYRCSLAGPASYQSAKGRVWGTVIERFVPMECNKPYKCNQKHVIKHGQDGSVYCLWREDKCEEKENSKRRQGDAVKWFFLKGGNSLQHSRTNRCILQCKWLIVINAWRVTWPTWRLTIRQSDWGNMLNARNKSFYYGSPDSSFRRLVWGWPRQTNIRDISTIFDMILLLFDAFVKLISTVTLNSIVGITIA